MSKAQAKSRRKGRVESPVSLSLALGALGGAAIGGAIALRAALVLAADRNVAVRPQDAATSLGLVVVICAVGGMAFVGAEKLIRGALGSMIGGAIACALYVPSITFVSQGGVTPSAAELIQPAVIGLVVGPAVGLIFRTRK